MIATAMSKIDPKLLTYEGCDLEAMSQAPKYYRWLISIIQPYFGDTVVEVGAGSGSFSKQLLAIKPKKAIFIEPTKNMFRLLKENVAKNKSKSTQVATYNAYLPDLTKQLRAEKPDTFIYINVFEHIEDDLKELKILKDLLSQDGHVIIFVPAHQALFSKFDESIGHYRRYSKKTVSKLANDAGLEIVKVRYMDMIGTVPWWISFKVLKRMQLTPKLVGIYDRFFIPVIRAVETVLPTTFGKNILLVARKK